MGWGRSAAAALALTGAAALAVIAASGGTDQPAWWQVLAVAAVAAIPIGLGLLLAVRRPRVAVGPLLVALGVAPLVVFAADSWAQTATTADAWPGAQAAGVFSRGGWIWFYIPAALLVALFPDGHLPSRWRPWMGVGVSAVVFIFHVAVALDPSTYADAGGTAPGAAPLVVPRWVYLGPGLVALAGLLLLLVGSALILLGRYRAGDWVVRRQIRWLLLGGFLLPAVLVACWVSILLTGDAGAVVPVGLLLVFLALPVGTAIGVLRYDLYDIDRLLSRTVSWTVVTACLSAVFAGIVLVAGLVLGNRSAPAVALATLACAVAFGRVRERVQRVVDRRFDRDHAAAIAEVARFVEQVRDGRSVPEQIDGVLRAALRDPQLKVAFALPTADGGSSWLDGQGNRVQRPDEPRTDVAPGDRVVCSIGYAATTAARPGLLGDVLRHAYLPLELARSRLEVRAALAETEASRARLLRAGYEERRRLERDLHDGAQQRLVAVGMSLRHAQRQLPPGTLYDSLDNAVGALQEAVAELRRISQGVRPSGLDEGLHAALRALLDGSPVPVLLQVTPERVHDTVATTAYYVAAEAVANALKHAQPTKVSIEVTRIDQHLLVRVVDDGVGGAKVVPGSGLAGIGDRVAAVGGTLAVRSEPGAGTALEALLPCAS